jgi:four helix bundle protein
MKDQIRRAAASISNNIAEGFEYNNNSAFIRFLIYAKGSCGELRNQIFILKEIQYIEPLCFEEINNRCIELSKQMASFIKYLKGFNQKKD